jgi:hypothetical protein
MKTLGQRYAAEEAEADAVAASHSQPKRATPSGPMIIKMGRDLRRRQ